MTALRTLLTRQASRLHLETSDLRPAATARQLAELASAFGASLPSDLLELLGLADGQPPTAMPLFGRWRLLGVGEILSSARVLGDLAVQGDFDGEPVQADPGIRPAWWLVGWLPFAANGAGDRLCLDLLPTASGVVGQVIEFRHEEGRRKRLASSLREWAANH